VVAGSTAVTTLTWMSLGYVVFAGFLLVVISILTSASRADRRFDILAEKERQDYLARHKEHNLDD